MYINICLGWEGGVIVTVCLQVKSLFLSFELYSGIAERELLLWWVVQILDDFVTEDEINVTKE